MAPKSKAAKTTGSAKDAKSPLIPTPGKQSVNWPPMRPLAPTADLSLHTLLENQIITIPRFWTANLCKTYIAFLSTLPLTTTPGKPKKGEAVRVNDRFQVDDARFAEQLWAGTGLKELCTNVQLDGVELDEEHKRELWGGEVIGLNPNIRIYRYGRGQFFDQHYDDSNNVELPSTGDSFPTKAKTTWTLLLYLSSDCIGGETVFYPDPPSKREPTPPPIVAELDVGMALLHRHGKDCLLHEGREVTEGEKWVIRSDLCVLR